MGVAVFLCGGRVVLAGARVVVAREAAGAAAVPTAGGGSSSPADGGRGSGGTSCSPVDLADLNDVILAVEAERMSSGRLDSG
eukprot:6002490-Pleurochrysis_carterae.AAC.1